MSSSCKYLKLNFYIQTFISYENTWVHIFSMLISYIYTKIYYIYIIYIIFEMLQCICI